MIQYTWSVWSTDHACESIADNQEFDGLSSWRSFPHRVDLDTSKLKAAAIARTRGGGGFSPMSPRSTISADVNQTRKFGFRIIFASLLIFSSGGSVGIISQLGGSRSGNVATWRIVGLAGRMLD